MSDEWSDLRAHWSKCAAEEPKFGTREELALMAQCRAISDREALLAESIQLMREFCAKVEAGTIQSANTYRKMKDIIRRYDK